MRISHWIDGFFLSLAVGMTTFLSPVCAQSNIPPVSPSPEEAQEEESAPLPTTITPMPSRSYIGIGPALGLSGSSTSLSSGGLGVVMRQVLSDNLSIRNSSVIFGSRIPSSNIALTLDLPIRSEESGDILVSPFLGGGAGIRNEDATIYISPHATAGVDVPLPMGVTGLIHLNMGFPANRQADIGLLIGVGVNF
jgi:hypothetical protein